MKKYNLILGILLIHSVIPKSYASTTFGAVGAYNNSTLNLSQTTSGATTSSNYEFGGGLLITSQFYRSLGAEVGFLYLQNKVNSAVEGSFTGTGTVTWDTFQIPVIIRFWLFPALSLGAGGYVEHLVGSVKSVTNITRPITTTSTQNNTPTPRDGFGAVFSAQLQVPVWGKLRWITDARYEIGITEFNDLAGGSTGKSNHLIILSGFGLHF